VKWDKAVAKLVKDRDALLTFYDFPAEHWKHIRTSNPIESTFALASDRHFASVAREIPSSPAKRLRGMLFGGSIFARTAAFRSDE
jgi:transposase-like protein